MKNKLTKWQKGIIVLSIIWELIAFVAGKETAGYSSNFSFGVFIFASLPVIIYWAGVWIWGFGYILRLFKLLKYIPGIKYFLICFKKYFIFKGRARRKEYWYFILFNFIILISIIWVYYTLFPNSTKHTPMPITVYQFIIFIPWLAVATRRLHDIGKSGWWVLPGVVLSFTNPMISSSDSSFAMILGAFLGLFSIVYVIAMLLFLVRKGTEGENRFGPDPLKQVQ